MGSAGKSRGVLLAAMGLATVALAASPGAVGLKSIDHEPLPDGDRFVIEADAPLASYRPYQYALGGRQRFVLDIPFATHGLDDDLVVSGAVVTSVKVSRVEEEGVARVRLLFELTAAADSVVEARGTTLVLDLRARRDAAPGAPAVASVASTERPPIAGDVSRPPVAASQEYRVGIGDVLKVTVFEQPDLGGSFRVEPGGQIQVPLAGRIRAEGMTVMEIQAGLRAVLDRDYIVNPQVTVVVEEYRSQSVDVTGAVRQPGRYYLQGSTRLQDIISLAGGAAAEAGEEIVVTRGKEGAGSPIRVRRSELYSGANPELNVLLIPGDVIEVGSREAISVAGEVARPGSYDWRPGVTVLQVVAMAGGPTVWAKERAEILRGQRRIEVDLEAIRKGKLKDVALEPGDHVSVKRRIL